MEKNAVITKWDEASNEWLQSLDKNNWRNQLLMPFIMDSLGDVKGKTIIDIGCGEGEYSRVLAERGADVTGIDGSSNLISAAKERSQSLQNNLNYSVCNASHLEGIETEKFDIVLSTMCLMALVDFHEAIAEMARVLKPRGRVVLSTLHPCFSGPNFQIIQHNGSTLSTNDQYFTEGWYEELLSKTLGKSLPFYHRTLQNFIMPFLNMDFILRRIVEPYPSDDLLKKFPDIALLRKVPLFIILEFEKFK